MIGYNYMARKKINLAVIFYGRADRLASNDKQFFNLKKSLFDFNVKKYDFNKGQKEILLKDFRNNEIDVALKNSYGREHESYVEDFLELNRIPYFGSNAKTTFIGTSKFLSKQVFRKHNLPVVDDVFVDKIVWHENRRKVIKNIIDKIGFPCLAKDVGGTDSHGIYKINSRARIKKVLDTAVVAHAEGVIVEKFINNAYEAVCLAVGNKNPKTYIPLGISHKGGQDIFSAEMKNIKNSMRFDLPARMPKAVTQRIKKITRLAHQALSCRTFSRADILVAKNKLYLLEVDVHTGFSRYSAATVSAGYEGEDLNQLFLKFYKLSKEKS